jgi:hypothetical protein
MVYDYCFSEVGRMFYTDSGSMSPPSCTAPTGTAPVGCGCSCATSTGGSPCHFCFGTQTTYCLPPEWDKSGSTSSTFYQQVLLDYVDQTATSFLNAWNFDTGTSIINTNASVNFTSVRLRFSNLAVPVYDPVTTGGTGNALCCDWVPLSTSTYALYYWFRERARYTNDVNAMGVYGSPAAYADWTIEITGADCIVRDNLGVIKYQFALSAYTMDGLRIAIDATTELVGRRIILATGIALRSAPATKIPAQGPHRVGSSIGDEAKIRLRSAGDEVESYQPTPLLAAYFSNVNNANPPVGIPQLTEDLHSGSITTFRQGFRKPAGVNLFGGFSWPPAAMTPDAWNHIFQLNCTSTSTCSGRFHSPSIGLGGSGGFGGSTDPVLGTVYEYEHDGVDGKANPAAYGTFDYPDCVRWACENRTIGLWEYFGGMWELERI